MHFFVNFINKILRGKGKQSATICRYLNYSFLLISLGSSSFGRVVTVGCVESEDALKCDLSSPLIETKKAFNYLSSSIHFSLYAVLRVSKL